jgi:hypothetical protein
MNTHVESLHKLDAQYKPHDYPQIILRGVSLVVVILANEFTGWQNSIVLLGGECSLQLKSS